MLNHIENNRYNIIKQYIYETINSIELRLNIIDANENRKETIIMQVVAL
jgi:hypothetical protein